MHFKCKTVQTLATPALSKPRSLSLVFGYQNNPKISVMKIRKKNQNFWFMEKYFFQYSWSCMELYGNKFFVYGSCMIRSFRQPGFVLPFVLLVSLIIPETYTHQTVTQSCLNAIKLNYNSCIKSKLVVTFCPYSSGK